MEIQWKKNVRVICDLEVGDKVKTDNWGPQLDNKIHTVEEIIEAIGKCESGFRIKIDGYKSTLDSNWLIKIDASTLTK
jgi:hypothetical protein